MIKIYHKKFSIKQLEGNFKDCIYAVPQLQRNYVWDKKRVCLFLDSIFNHYPIGVSLIWKAKSSKISEIKPNNRTILPSFNINRKSIDYIIDGQQRLTSLYGVLFGIHEAIDFNSNIDFRKIYYSFKNKDENRFIFLNRYDISRGDYIPLCEILRENARRLKSRFNLSQNKLSTINSVKNKILSYKFHFIFIETNSVDQVRETFVRINSQGMTVAKADALFARTTNIGLRDLVDNTRRAMITRQYNEMRPESIIYTLSLSKGEKEVGKRALDNFVKKFKKKRQFKINFQKEWKKYHKAFLVTVDYLANEFGVTTYSLLPSANIFTMLAYFFYLKKGRPSPHQKREINKWFWHTTIGERYSGIGFNRNIPKDIEFFKRLVHRKNYKYSISDKINPNEFLKKDYRRLNFSAVLGYYLFLKLSGPRYLENGEKMLLDNALSISNRKDRHHIFPNALLTRKKINPKLKHSLLNICFLAANENESVSDGDPNHYLMQYKRKRFFKRVMKTYFIPYKKNDGIWDANIRNGFKNFLNARANLILNGISKLSGCRRNQLFEKYEQIKRIS